MHLDKDITVIILGSKLQNLTDNCIKTIQETSETKIIVVMCSYIGLREQRGDVQYIHVDLPFNYNKFANIGCEAAKTELLVIANNDLLFQKDWSKGLLFWANKGRDVISPREPKDKRHSDITTDITGYKCGRHFCGWCFMIKKSTWEKIHGFDEDFGFWCADNAVIEQLKKINVKPVLSYDSVVVHLGSQTLNTLPKAEYDELTKVQVQKFNKKYNQNLFNLGK